MSAKTLVKSRLNRPKYPNNLAKYKYKTLQFSTLYLCPVPFRFTASYAVTFLKKHAGEER